MRGRAFVMVANKKEGEEVRLEIQPLVLCSDCKYKDTCIMASSLNGEAGFCSHGVDKDDKGGTYIGS